MAHNKPKAILVFFVAINSIKFNKTNASKEIEKSIKKKFKLQLNAIQSYGIITKRWSETTFNKNCQLDFYKQFQQNSTKKRAKCVYHIEFFHEIAVTYKHKAPQNWGHVDQKILKAIIQQNGAISSYQQKYNIEFYTLAIYHQFLHLIWNKQKIFEIRTALNHVPFAAECDLQEIIKLHIKHQKKQAKRVKKGKSDFHIIIQPLTKQRKPNAVLTKLQRQRQRQQQQQRNIANNNLRFFNNFMNEAHQTFYQTNNFMTDPFVATKMENDPLFKKCTHYAYTEFNVSYNSFILNKPLRCWKKFKGKREYKTVNHLRNELRKEQMEIS